MFEQLAPLTGDGRWRKAAATAIALVAELTRDGRSLPPDWAAVSGVRLVPIAEPGGSATVRYSLDAARVPIWFATACNRSATNLAARWWRNLLGSGDRSAPAPLGLTGDSINGDSSPVTLLVGAAAATAAGSQAAAREPRARAGALALRTPTYYGDAWIALGGTLLDRSIASCDGPAYG